MPFMVKIDDDGILWFQRSWWTSISWHDKRETTFQFAWSSTEQFASANSKYTKLRKNVQVAHVVNLSDDDFIALRNGGKRRPMKPKQSPGAIAMHTIKTDSTLSALGLAAPTVKSAGRLDRRGDFVREGDVGPYKSGPDNISPKLHPLGAIRTMPTAGPGAFVAQDGSRGVRTIPSHPDKMNKDHMNNQAALLARGDNPSSGLAITIPQWVHMNGYTFGAYGAASKLKHGSAHSRTQWISANPGLGLYKEFFHELRVYHEAGKLDCEIVGSYRYLYRLHMKGGNAATHKNPQIAKLLMFYLELAAKKVPASDLVNL